MMSNTFCFSIATMVAGMRLYSTLYLHCLGCYQYGGHTKLLCPLGDLFTHVLPPRNMEKSSAQTLNYCVTERSKVSGGNFDCCTVHFV